MESLTYIVNSGGSGPTASLGADIFFIPPFQNAGGLRTNKIVVDVCVLKSLRVLALRHVGDGKPVEASLGTRQSN